MCVQLGKPGSGHSEKEGVGERSGRGASLGATVSLGCWPQGPRGLASCFGSPLAGGLHSGSLGSLTQESRLSSSLK